MSAVCAGCGGTYEPKAPSQSRCPTCVVSILSILGDMPTESLRALVLKNEEWKSAIPLSHVVDKLNEALALDPRAITELVRSRVKVNSSLVTHKTFRVYYPGDDADGGSYYLGVVGLLNGVFGSVNGHGVIAFEERKSGQGHITKFVMLEEESSGSTSPETGEEVTG